VVDVKRVKLLAVIDEKTCAGCSLCIVNCPVGCIKISQPKKHGDINTFAYLFKPETCIGCKMCQKVCPIDAITMMEI
jgi:formate hydrogenlyase subunit 6/NADH:ubiquinone oxidoreductase subunit I